MRVFGDQRRVAFMLHGNVPMVRQLLNTHAANLPHKCISGRWLSVSNTERFIVKVAEHAPDIVRNAILKHQPVSEKD